MIDGPRTFGASQEATTETRERKPQAKLWMNIGYMAGEGETAKFVSLPLGLPLDTMDALDVRSTSDFGKFRSAQNELLRQVQEEAAKLAPGEEKILTGDCQGLCIQLRRRNDGEISNAVDESNPYTPAGRIKF